MTASTRSRRDLSAGRKSRMPRGGLTDATALSFQVGSSGLRRPPPPRPPRPPLSGRLGGADLGFEPPQPPSEGAFRVPAVRPGGGHQAEERIAERGLGLDATIRRILAETGSDA